jgi:drug/metabolite transporter (DMT)-like permease
MVIAALLVMRPQLGGVGAALPILVVIGVFDVLANALFAVASTKGILPVVAVGASMYPAFTIALAHGVLGERLVTVQWAGVVLALTGVGLIAGGG